MKAHTYVSFDCIKPHYIVYCDHMKPMAHTCAANRAIDCDNKAITKLITLNEFIVEYCRRLEVQDPNSPAWGVPASMVAPAYVALMLKVTLETIAQCIKKHSGLVEYRRTEYTANATHHITHRIWLQLSLKWDFRFGEDAQNSLFLNVADHFRWDG
ncbi:F-box protein [Babesia caballi]|uniref:F-box protein n=1 Tax=Babesia caballi TaxID=5871 RepID=A0AAV4LNG8_BABCB|nr:F-box protein [Babesia caballi]